MADIHHLELLAEIDTLVAELRAWADRAPDWPTARGCQALVYRLIDRADTLRVRLEAPLVVATLGGTGTGKSTLVNALVGDEVTSAGHLRPTTRQPVLICSPRITPQQLGIDPAEVHLVQVDLPALRDLVLLDCPDPDTTDAADADAAGTNLARLRTLLPHCDVLLVTSTQQKYRSARVADELAAAAPGARLVFVQTNADRDDDIRDDWRRILAAGYSVSDMFLIDSPAALADARVGRPPRGDFGRLTDLLSRQLAGAAGHRIRRANFLELIDETLVACRQRMEEGLPAVAALESGIAEQRARLAGRLAGQMREELLANRRAWEARLLGEIASRWGFSPFSLLLRLYQGLGGYLTGGLLLRARSPAQLALVGAIEGGRMLRRRDEQRQADQAPERAVAWSWDETELRTSAIIVDGYAAEAGLPRADVRPEAVVGEAADVGTAFIAGAAADLQSLIGRLARRHTGWFTRWRYEIALGVMLAIIVYRLGRNFFFDSWLAPQFGVAPRAEPLLGTDFFLQAAFWLLAWSVLLLWAFTSRLRRGLRSEIEHLAERWRAAPFTSGLFRGLETRCRDIHQFHQECQRLSGRVTSIEGRLSGPEPLSAVRRTGRQPA
jgi:hypothetical protein